MTVCRICYDGNWDGWGRMLEPRILKHLKDQGVPAPDRNGEGWLPRDF
jgi:hypothetical protein